MSERATEAPGISVVIPTHQRRELVREAIASVGAQTHRDFELIVIDDGSTDGTREMLGSLGDWGGRLRHRCQPNRGVSAARNAAIALSRGPVIAFLDSDDLWLPEHLEVISELMARFPEAVLATTCSAYRMSGSARVDRARLVECEHPTLFASLTAGYMSGLAVRREALREAGGFDRHMAVAEDSDLLCRIGLTGPFAVLRKQTFIRRITAGSLERTARVKGDYLHASDRLAENLVGFARQLPEPRRSALLAQAQGHAGVARALCAIDRRDKAALAAELEATCRLLPLSEAPAWVDDKLRRRLPRGDETLGRLEARQMATEAWPDPAAPTPRYLRLLAIGSALRAGRPRTALRLAAGWPRRGNLAAAPKLIEALGERLGRQWQRRRHRTA